jgi:class 3 adenylate cyclase
MAADVAGYSRLMHNDEEATHAGLRALLADVVEPVIAEHGGHIVKNTGDGFLAVFERSSGGSTAMQFRTVSMNLQWMMRKVAHCVPCGHQHRRRSVGT